MDFFGWIGNILLSLCGIPQALDCYKKGNSNGISIGFIFMWFNGEVFTFIYVLSFKEVSIPLVLNYIVNILILLVIIRYKIFPKKA